MPFAWSTTTPSPALRFSPEAPASVFASLENAIVDPPVDPLGVSVASSAAPPTCTRAPFASLAYTAKRAIAPAVASRNPAPSNFAAAASNAPTEDAATALTPDIGDPETCVPPSNTRISYVDAAVAGVHAPVYVPSP